MLQLGFELAIPLFETSKAILALDRVVIHVLQINCKAN
jgi:hypothetical protein